MLNRNKKEIKIYYINKSWILFKYCIQAENVMEQRYDVNF